MKKNEIKILAVLAVIALLAIGILYLKKPKGSGIKVDVVHREKVVIEFDPYVDAVYELTGDYGHMEVEVKDHQWRVINEECPNHICSSMGWMSVNDIIPITCIPNNVYIYVAEKPE